MTCQLAPCEFAMSGNPTDGIEGAAPRQVRELRHML